MTKEMTDRELDVAVAEKVMGWKPEVSLCIHEGCVEYQNGYLRLSGCDCENDEEKPPTIWNPSGSISSAFRMEEEIKRQGKHQKYANYLVSIIFARGDAEHGGACRDSLHFKLAHASPRIRCLAALKTMEGK